MPQRGGEINSMNAATISSIAHLKPLRLINRPAFLQFTLLLIYGHAVGYRILEYYKPGSGKLLTFGIAFILTATMGLTALRVLTTMKIAGGLPMLFFLLFVLMGTFSLLNMYLYWGTIDFSQFGIGFYKTVLPIALAFLAYSSVRKVSEGFKVLILTAWINALLGAIGLMTYLFADRWVQFYLQLPQVEKLPLHFGGVLRMTSIIWNPLVFGTLMALNGIIAWSMILHASKRSKYFWIGVFVISVVCAIASFTRTAWLMLFVGITALSGFVVKRLILRFMVISIATVMVAAAVLSLPIPMGKYNNVREAIVDHVKAAFAYEHSRLENLEVNIRRIAVYPIGYGLGTAGYAALPTEGVNSPVVFLDFIAADNNYLSMALQVGLPGLLIFVLAQVAVLKRLFKGWREAREERERAILVAVIGMMVGMGVGAFSLNVWEYNLVPHIAYAMIGVGLKLSYEERACEPPVPLSPVHTCKAN